MIGGSLLEFHLGGLLRFAGYQLSSLTIRLSTPTGEGERMRERKEGVGDIPMEQQLNDVPTHPHQTSDTIPTIYPQISSLALR
jgi:hypothetical protein